MLNKRKIYPTIFFSYISVWTLINLLFLNSFPFMHTDESWLAGLSRAIFVENNPAATEPFFNLVKRSPHAIKIIFHYLQILFIRIFGYSLFSVRLVSLLSGTMCLITFGGICKKLHINRIPAVIMLSIQIQFIYASHFARQEIQILLLMLLSILISLSTKRADSKGFIRGLLTGIPIAAAIGFHPNAFISAWPPGLIILTDILKKRRFAREGAGFLIYPAVMAVFFILLSKAFNSDFIEGYSSLGSEVGFFDPIDIKLLGLDDFYQKLFLRISGTYYTPEIKPIFLFSLISLPLYIFFQLKNRLKNYIVIQIALSGIIGVNIGIVLIGKYSAPSIVFIIPFLILILAGCLQFIKQKLIYFLIYIAVFFVLFVNSFLMISYETIKNADSYSNFINQITAVVPPLQNGESSAESRVLGPLTAEFALEYGRLIDWRNMALLRQAGTSLEDWINGSNIKYIIYTEELDVIYRNRPVWNLLYGNPTIYHEQLQNFISQRCELLSEYSSPSYGTRIVFKRLKKDWRVQIYKVNITY